jgi:hypothetical protein
MDCRVKPGNEENGREIDPPQSSLIRNAGRNVGKFERPSNAKG